jgi:hypothetical protein
MPAIAATCALSATPACGFAVKHPAVTAGIVAGTLGFTTCKLASDNYAACGVVAGGAGAFLGLVTAAALWLGGDGNSSAIEEQAQPLSEDDQPPLRLPPLPDADSPTPPPTGSPVGPSSTSPSSNPPSPPNPPTHPRPASPSPTSAPSTSLPSTSPPSANPQPPQPMSPP